MKYKIDLSKTIFSLTINTVIMVTASTVSLVAYAQPLSSLMDKRVQSAEDLIKNIDELKTNAQHLHASTEYIIAQAKRLQGETSQFEIKTPVINGGTKMNAIQLQAAKQQYQSDINQFTEHAKAYNQHLKDFQILVGECHASSQALTTVLQKYQIHVAQFHIPMPAIRPPHICGALQERVGDLSGVARQMMGDQIRVIQSEAQLNQEEQGLQLANGAATNLQTKAMLTAQRAKGEVGLAGEFGRLKEEYNLLKTEKDTIEGAKSVNASLAHTSVSGQIIKKH